MGSGKVIGSIVYAATHDAAGPLTRTYSTISTRLLSAVCALNKRVWTFSYTRCPCRSRVVDEGRGGVSSTEVQGVAHGELTPNEYLWSTAAS